MFRALVSVLIVALAVLAATAPALADYRAGQAAYKKEDFQAARKIFLAAAEKGDDRAMMSLGVMAARGEGAERDINKAAEWFERAAKAGNIHAAFDLARMRYRGVGGPRDFDAAVRWFEFAANKGHYSAMNALTLILGTGARLDFTKALKYARMGAKYGYAPTQFQLGLMYYHGEGLEKNIEDAYFWIFLAAKESEPYAISSLAKLRTEMTKAEIQAVEKRAEAWQPARWKSN